VDRVSDPLFFFPGSAGNRTRASGSVAKNSDHYTTEAVSVSYNLLEKYRHGTLLIKDQSNIILSQFLPPIILKNFDPDIYHTIIFPSSLRPSMSFQDVFPPNFHMHSMYHPISLKTQSS
jgi:hypothetical protein